MAESSESNSDLSSEVPKKKRNQDVEELDESQTFVTQIRILLPNADGGAVIGKGGENAKHLKYKYHAKVSVADCSTPERILKVEAMIAVIRAVVLDIMRFINASDEERRLKVMIHDSQAGVMIGKSGNKIKKLKEKCNTFIKVYPRCAPNSTERVYEVIGKPQDIALTVLNVTQLLYPIQPLGVMVYYDPENYTDYLIEEYGGYRFEEGFPKGYIGKNSMKAFKAKEMQKRGYAKQRFIAEGGTKDGKIKNENEIKTETTEKPMKRKRGCRAGKHKRNRVLHVCAMAIRENKAAEAAAEVRHLDKQGFEGRIKHSSRPFGTMANSHHRPSHHRLPPPSSYRSMHEGPRGPMLMAPPIFNPIHQQSFRSLPPPPRIAGSDGDGSYNNKSNFNNSFFPPPNHELHPNNFNLNRYNNQNNYNQNTYDNPNNYPNQSNYADQSTSNSSNYNNFNSMSPNYNINTNTPQSQSYDASLIQNNNFNVYPATNTSQSNDYYSNINNTTYQPDEAYLQTDELQNNPDDNNSNDNKEIECVQVNLPIDLLEAFANDGGYKLKQMAQEGGAEVTLEPSQIPNQITVSIKGNPLNVKSCQYLLQMSTMNFSGKPYDAMYQHQ